MILFVRRFPFGHSQAYALPFILNFNSNSIFMFLTGGGPRVVVSTAAFHARVQGSFPGLGSLKET